MSTKFSFNYQFKIKYLIACFNSLLSPITSTISFSLSMIIKITYAILSSFDESIVTVFLDASSPKKELGPI